MALWTAVRTLKERAALLRRLAESTGHQHPHRQAEELEDHARALEALIEATVRN